MPTLNEIIAQPYYVCIVDACIKVTSIAGTIALARTAANRRLVLVTNKPYKVIKRHKVPKGRMIVPLNSPPPRKFAPCTYHYNKGQNADFSKLF
jgi:hypothetical protein